MDYWKILLEEQRNRGRSGFTIPFIIGSQNFLKDKCQQQDIESLLVDMCSNASFTTCVRYCSDTNELIIEIKKENIPVVYPTFNGLSQQNFSVSIANNDLGNTCEEIIDSLTGKYLLFIQNGLYSVKNRDYGP